MVFFSTIDRWNAWKGISCRVRFQLYPFVLFMFLSLLCLCNMHVIISLQWQISWGVTRKEVLFSFFEKCVYITSEQWMVVTNSQNESVYIARILNESLKCIYDIIARPWDVGLQAGLMYTHIIISTHTFVPLSDSEDHLIPLFTH